jgi:5-(carboxyamino)imidazole ribonucleotide synthase
VYPAAQNHHTNGVLTWSVLPAPSLAPSLATDAHDLARDIATRLDLVGLLAVEMFWTTDGRLLVNELAPRPHNTYHASMRVSATSQFEQLVRAICDLPLGATDAMQVGAIHNVLGDAWTSHAPRITHALTVPTAALDLYGKRGARPGRKMGHLSTVAETADVALARVLEAYERLVSPGTD